MDFRSSVKKLIPAGLFAAVEPYGHLVEAVIFNILNGFPARGMKVIGVTGTNGKTSTAFMIHKMLQESGYNTGLMTTVAWGAGNDIKQQVHHYTNVPVPELMKRLKYLRAAKVDWVVMEITSQGLAQNRAWGVPFSVAVMTNVTHEHLDYHKTFERYRDAKRKLFKRANRHRSGLRTGVVNAEDPSAELFAADVKNPMLYGVKKGDVRASKVELSPSGVQYEVPSEKLKIECHLPGSFNVYNSLAAVCVGLKLGLESEQIERGIAALKGVEGRMTRIDEGQDFNVIVDYAHTPDSFEKLFKDIKPVVKGKLIVMFGSAGRRDEAKRAVQGELAGKYADEVVVTEEDDRDIDGVEIMDEIAAGAEKAGKQRDKDLFLVHDRTEAINFAVKRARKGDTVMLLGKGHEKTIERADGEHPWDEIGTAHQAVKKLVIKSKS
ncbi:MAG TPA: UDP-N-acetylmuramoyl-L-alanyl-D-glutamate--2,6-diaminopimelate ligase [Candidatus Saccharimonadales bacterium]|nr:UDP-N-acetylmuramoyl-L-alanyl-D-glutamate--2,6-diaminopimelate ligase [Candidatus Saccharimonadales bacterium]